MPTHLFHLHNRILCIIHIYSKLSPTVFYGAYAHINMQRKIPLKISPHPSSVAQFQPSLLRGKVHLIKYICKLTCLELETLPKINSSTVLFTHAFLLLLISSLSQYVCKLHAFHFSAILPLTSPSQTHPHLQLHTLSSAFLSSLHKPLSPST